MTAPTEIEKIIAKAHSNLIENATYRGRSGRRPPTRMRWKVRSGVTLPAPPICADMLRNLGGAELANVKLATIADALLTITKRQDRADADALARVEAVVERSMQLKGYSPIN